MKEYITPIIKPVQLSAEDILTLSVASGSDPNNLDFVKNFLTI